MKKIGIMGGRGCFNEQALGLLKERGDLSFEYKSVYLNTTEGVLKAIAAKEVDYGIFGIFNSRSHLVSETARVIGHYQFDVVSYITMPIMHYMLALPGVELAEIEMIMGHEEAIA